MDVKTVQVSHNILIGLLDSSLSGIIYLKSLRDGQHKVFDFQFAYINQYACEVINKRKEELLGRKVLEIFPGESRARQIELLRKIIITGEPVEQEYLNNKNEWFRIVGVKYDDGVMITFYDITEEKEKELRLENSEAFLKLSQSIAHVGSFDWDIINKKVAWTEENYKLFGEVQGKEVTDEVFISNIHPDDREKVLRKMDDSLKNRKDFNVVFRTNLEEESNQKLLWARGKLFCNESGQPIRMIGTTFDITERIEIERELKHKNRELESAKLELKKLNQELEKRIEDRTHELAESNKRLKHTNEGLDKFAYVISHDLKAPLHSIEPLAKMILEENVDSLDEESIQMIRMIIDRVNHMENLINGVLESVRSDKKLKEPVNLNDLLDSVISNMAIPPTIEIFIQHNFPKVYCNKIGLLRVFQNLIDNSLKFMDKPMGFIKIGYQRELDGSIKVCLKDNGKGISPELHDRIFKMFEVGHTDDHIQSTGIGLSEVKNIIEEAGGRIWFESTQGEGTTFYFTLPS